MRPQLLRLLSFRKSRRYEEDVYEPDLDAIEPFASFNGSDRISVLEESGIHLLPPEVLDIVFGMCIEDERYPIDDGHPLLVLSAVCSRWRSVAIYNSTLWASFRVNIPIYATPQRLSSLKNLLDIFIDRAQSQPLRMEIRHKGSLDPDPMPSRISSMRALFLKYFHLFTELDFITLTEDAYWRLASLGMDTSSFTKLETLSIRVKPRLDQSDPDLKLFRHAPNLRHICLHAESMLTTFKFNLPYQQVTRLDFRVKESSGDAAIMAWHYLLAECSNLEDAAVHFLCHTQDGCDGMGSTPPLGGNTKLQDFPTIKRLTIANDFGGDASAIFGGVARFPNLEHLEIRAKCRCKILSSKRDSEERSGRTSTSYLNLDTLRSAVALGGLKSLHLIKVSIHADALLTLLYSTPYLTELELLSVRDKRSSGTRERPYLTTTDQDILRILTASDHQVEVGDYLCPSLRLLSLRDPVDSEEGGGDLDTPYAELAQSRSKILTRAGIGTHFCLTLYFAKAWDGKNRRSMII